jgi:Holliday junction DNA helicase RuvB
MIEYKGVSYESLELLVRSGVELPPPAPPPRPKTEATPEPAPPLDSPPGLADVIGNAPAVLQIRTALDAHRERIASVGDGRTKEARALTFPHTLLCGPSGTGKTMLAEIIARETRRPMRVGMGQSLANPARVADFLLSLRAGDVLFVDEIHGLKPACQETFYRAMEGGVLMPIAKAGEPVASPISLPPFTLLGATTDEWRLLEPLLQRFRYRIRLERMTTDELTQAIAQRAERRGWALTDEAAGMIAQRAHGTPRLAVALLDGCMDVAIAGKATTLTPFIVERACEIFRLDSLGLDAVERRYLDILCRAHGVPVRLNVAASQLDNLSRRTVECRIEPTLIWLGLIQKLAEGRVLTEKGKGYLAKPARD